MNEPPRMPPRSQGLRQPKSASRTGTEIELALFRPRARHNHPTTTALHQISPTRDSQFLALNEGFKSAYDRLGVPVGGRARFRLRFRQPLGEGPGADRVSNGFTERNQFPKLTLRQVFLVELASSSWCHGTIRSWLLDAMVDTPLLTQILRFVKVFLSTAYEAHISQIVFRGRRHDTAARRACVSRVPQALMLSRGHSKAILYLPSLRVSMAAGWGVTPGQAFPGAPRRSGVAGMAKDERPIEGRCHCRYNAPVT